MSSSSKRSPTVRAVLPAKVAGISISGLPETLAAEMEGGAIGHVCYVNQVDFCVLRAVSDNGDENANQDYSIALELASGNALKVLEEFLKRLAKA